MQARRALERMLHEAGHLAVLSAPIQWHACLVQLERIVHVKTGAARARAHELVESNLVWHSIVLEEDIERSGIGSRQRALECAHQSHRTKVGIRIPA